MSKSAVLSHRKQRLSIIALLTLLLAVVSVSFGTIIYSANSNLVGSNEKDKRQASPVLKTNKLDLILGRNGFLQNSPLTPDAIFIVNNNGDSNDVAPGNGLCLDSNGNCTLRAAIQEANATDSADEIIFALATPTTIQLSPNLQPEELTITKPLTITGPGARLLIVNGVFSSGARNAESPDVSTAIFSVNTPTTVTTNISGLTIANTGGRGVNNSGKLNLSDVLIRNHQYGVYNTGNLNLTRALVRNNSRGGIYAALSSTANISNTTITSNSSLNYGGGIHSLSSDLTLNNVTINNNTAPTAGGGLYYNSGASGIYVRNTIIAGNNAPSDPDILSAGNSSGANFISRGNNLIGKSNGNMGFVNGTNADKVGTIAAPIDPMLGQLQNNGGQVDTITLLAGSPAKDAGNNCVTNSNCGGNNPPASFLLTDQRGGVEFPRNFENGVDIGAFEAYFPTPELDSLSPDKWGTGRGSFELTLNGSHFVRDSKVKWSGQERATTFVSNNQLKAQILASDVTTAGVYPVSVTNPAPNGGTSETINFTVADCTFSISPTSQSFTSSGGNGGINVTTTSGCVWTATPSASWITISSGSNGTGNGTVSFSVAPNVGQARTGTITVGGQIFNISQASGCTVTINPTSQSFATAGGTGSFAVTADNGCQWTAATGNSWITFTGSASGTGNGTVNFTVAANKGPARTGTITVGDKTFTVNQDNGCTFNINPTSQNVAAAGAPGSFALTASGSGCQWNATSSDSWITINGSSSGSGNGTINFSVAANTGPQRTGTITVGGQTFTITQQSGCAFTLSPTSTTIAGSGSSGFFDVSSAAGCQWTAVSNDSWITVTSGSPGTGSGRVNFTVAANTGPARTGTITVGNQTFTVNQQTGCAVTINPTSHNAGAAGGPGSFAVTASNGCQWNAITTDSWITITGSASGSGNGTVNFTVAANTGPQRTGTITVGGQTFTVTQANGCSFTLTPTSTNVPAAGAPGSFNVTTVTGCQWTAVSNASWITVTSGANGSGNGAVNFSVAANTGFERTGTISVNGQNFTITQASGCTITLSPTSTTIAAGGGTGNFNVTTASGCQWTAVSNVSWITVTGGTPGNGNGTVNFTVAANTGPARTGTITVGDKTFTVNQDNGCTFTLTPASINFTPGGGPGFFDVSAGAGCTWTATSNATWITLTGGTPGNGNGRVSFTVAANTGPARTGTITVGNQTFTVNQENGCTFTINPTSQTIGAAGGPGSFTIVASNSGCQWNATTNDSWITITTASGTGNGTINFAVAANTGPQRTGTITVGGQTFTITQSNGCTYTLSPTGTNFQSAGGSGSFSVTVNNQACTWTATTSTPWITVNPPTSGTGNGTVNFTVAANISPQRTGTITVGNQTFTITQENGCTYTLSASSTNISAAGGTGSFNVNTGAGCTWAVQSNASWITITSSANGTGGGSVTFSVAANIGPERSGTITAAGQTFTVNQTNGCSFTLSPTSKDFGASGGSGSFTVTASHSGCTWNAAPGALWITITSGGSGTGNGTVQFTVAANISPERVGTITVGNGISTKTFTITQANGCAYSISPTSTGVDELGGNRSFEVMSGPGCTWSAVSNDSWITVTGGATGSGNGTVTLSIAATNGPERAGTVTAAGKTFTVNQISLRVTNLNDSGIGSLRRAISNANSTPNNDVITFAPSLAGNIVLTTGEIKIENNGALEIRGPGANNLKISGNNNSRIFYINHATVTISGLMLWNGNGMGTGSSELEKYGGAIYFLSNPQNQGSVRLDRVEIFRNIVTVPAGGRSIGGGIYYFGGLNHSIENSTISFNESDFGAGFYSHGKMTISNSTFYGNKAKKLGGAMYLVADVKIRSTTITKNGTTNTGHTGAGIMIEGAIVNTANTIISENIGPEITFEAGGFFSEGSNLIGDTPGDSANTKEPVPYHPSDIRDVPPLIAVLHTYGGSMATAALFPGSPAINAASNIDIPATDQRGSPRGIDGNSDIGAFEHNITISPSNPILPNATLGVFYSQPLTTFRSDNTDPSGYFEYFIADGFLTSSGIELIQESGTIRGTATSGGEYNFTVKAVGADGMAGAKRYSLTVGCSISISPTNQSFNPAGGTGTINVTAASGCTWTAVSDSPWISVTSGANGNGNGTVNFSVAANGTGSARSGKVIVGGKEFTINQASDCTFSINPTTQNVGSTGGTGSFAVTASGGGCQWSANSGTLWITITGGASGTGNGTVNYSISSNNTGAARTGTIIAGGQTFTINQAASLLRRVAYEFDGDGKSDVAVFRPSTGGWYILGSRDGFSGVQFGIATDRPVPADYDGDGKTDIAVFRDGVWYLLKSRDGFEAISFGIATDKPVPGDYDGDGKADAAVYRDGNWYLLKSRDGFEGIAFGIVTDRPIPADYDGDGKTDLAVYRDGAWYLLKSRDGFEAINFGIATDKPIPGDYDGDGKADAAVYRDGAWYLLKSRDGFVGISFGVATDRPVPADYDGDGKTDIAVFRDGTWHMLDSGQSESQAYRAVQFGESTDIPIPASLQ